MLLRWPDRTLVVPPRYLGSVEYYALISAFGHVVVDGGIPFDKRQKAVHRCDIADTHGPVSLTVPISNPWQPLKDTPTAARPRWADVRISGHFPWWHTHWVTLESAFGRTPFFEFYADDFAPLFSPDWVGKPITDFDFALHTLLCRLLQLETTSDPSENFEPSENSEPSECREPARTALSSLFSPLSSLPYYQVRQSSQGFHSGLSVVDLLFNLGPEAPLHLLRLNRMIVDK